jgi:hypothetical protein
MHFQILFENPIDPELVPELEKAPSTLQLA